MMSSQDAEQLPHPIWGPGQVQLNEMDKQGSRGQTGRVEQSRGQAEEKQRAGEKEDRAESRDKRAKD